MWDRNGNWIELKIEEMKEDTGPGVIKLTNTDHIKILTEDLTWLVYMRCLLKLASTNVNKVCSVEGWNSSITLRTENIGSALYIYWEPKSYYLFLFKKSATLQWITTINEIGFIYDNFFLGIWAKTWGLQMVFTTSIK